MVAQHPIGPSTRGQRRFVLGNQSGDRSGVPGRAEQAEIERKVQASEVTPVISDQPLERQIDLADEHTIGEFVATRRISAMTSCTSGRSAVYRGTRRWCGRSVARKPAFGGLSRNSASLIRCQMTSTRNPSTPRRNKKRIAS